MQNKRLIIFDCDGVLVDSATLSHKHDMSVIGFLGGGHTKYNWYENNIKEYDISIAKNADGLLNLLAGCYL